MTKSNSSRHRQTSSQRGSNSINCAPVSPPLSRRDRFSHAIKTQAGHVVTSIQVASATTLIGMIGAVLYFASETVSDAVVNWHLNASEQLKLAKDFRHRGFAEFERSNTTLAQIYYAQEAAVLKTLADHGNHIALFELGKLTCVGFGVQKNERLAKEYFNEAKLSLAQRKEVLSMLPMHVCLDTKSNETA